MKTKAKKITPVPKGLKVNIPLAPLTTFRVGGPASYFQEVKDLSTLKQALIWAKANKIPVFLLGNGSNLLVSDYGFGGLVIKPSGEFKTISKKPAKRGKVLIEAGAGITLGQLGQYCRKHNLGGLEFLFGIPGTLGGAVVMNAGAFGGNLGQYIENVVTISPNGVIKRLNQKSCRFGYRTSVFQKTKLIITSVLLSLSKQAYDENKVRGFSQLRRQSQPWGFSAGSVFKNPPVSKQNPFGLSAGALIEKCGLKGIRIGGAEVSTKHANFIMNVKNATAKDIAGLIKLTQKKVKNNFKINLEAEIKPIGKFQ